MWCLRKIQASDSEFELSKQIRKSVFVEEQGVSEREEYDSFENVSSHYLVFQKDEAIATARWRATDFGIKLERFAVLPKFREKGVGCFLVKEILEEVKGLTNPIYLHAQIQVVKFYQNLGFEKVGSIFEEAGIKHYKMLFKP